MLTTFFKHYESQVMGHPKRYSSNPAKSILVTLRACLARHQLVRQAKVIPGRRLLIRFLVLNTEFKLPPIQYAEYAERDHTQLVIWLRLSEC